MKNGKISANLWAVHLLVLLLVTLMMTSEAKVKNWELAQAKEEELRQMQAAIPTAPPATGDGEYSDEYLYDDEDDDQLDKVKVKDHEDKDPEVDETQPYCFCLEHVRCRPFVHSLILHTDPGEELDVEAMDMRKLSSFDDLKCLVDDRETVVVGVKCCLTAEEALSMDLDLTLARRGPGQARRPAAAASGGGGNYAEQWLRNEYAKLADKVWKSFVSRTWWMGPGYANYTTESFHFRNAEFEAVQLIRELYFYAEVVCPCRNPDRCRGPPYGAVDSDEAEFGLIVGCPPHSRPEAATSIRCCVRDRFRQPEKVPLTALQKQVVETAYAGAEAICPCLDFDDCPWSPYLGEDNDLNTYGNLPMCNGHYYSRRCCARAPLNDTLDLTSLSW